MSLQLFKANRFIQRLVDQEIVTDEQLRAAVEARKGRYAGYDMLSVLVALGYVHLGHVCEDLAERFEIPFVSLSEREIPNHVISLLDSRLARFYRVIPLEETAEELVVATDDPANLNVLQSVSRCVGRAVANAVATPDDISAALAKYYS